MRVKVSSVELSAIAEYVEDRSGILLDSGKSYLVETRLGPLLEKMECATYSDLLRKSKKDRGGDTLQKIVDAISTQETSFFRDTHPFKLFTHKLVPDHFEQSGSDGISTLRIWCAASSTGQELYSIAISLKELLGDLSNYRIRIVGTDISDDALATASAGRFTRLELARGINAEYLRRHFYKDGDVWRINDELRSITFFKKANILEPQPSLGSFDIIFCRNVAIYFSKENRQKLYQNISDRMTAESTLLIGSTESVIGVAEQFSRLEFHGSVYYNKS